MEKKSPPAEDLPPGKAHAKPQHQVEQAKYGPDLVHLFEGHVTGSIVDGSLTRSELRDRPEEVGGVGE